MLRSLPAFQTARSPTPQGCLGPWVRAAPARPAQRGRSVPRESAVTWPGKGRGLGRCPPGGAGLAAGGTASEENLFMKRTLGICSSGNWAAQGRPASPQ